MQLLRTVVGILKCRPIICLNRHLRKSSWVLIMVTAEPISSFRISGYPLILASTSYCLFFLLVVLPMVPIPKTLYVFTWLIYDLLPVHFRLFSGFPPHFCNEILFPTGEAFLTFKSSLDYLVHVMARLILIDWLRIGSIFLKMSFQVFDCIIQLDVLLGE